MSLPTPETLFALLNADQQRREATLARIRAKLSKEPRNMEQMRQSPPIPKAERYFYRKMGYSHSAVRAAACLPTLQTKVGDYVRVCYHAKRGDTVKAAPILPARLSKPLRVTGAWPHGVRIGGDSVHTGAWFSSWVRCTHREPDPETKLNLAP